MPQVQVLALYLLSAPGSNMIGLYYLPIPVILHESGLSAEATRRGLDALHEIKFAEYDATSEHVWVYDMARWQVLGHRKIASPRDKRVKGVRQQLQRLAKNPFTDPPFYERYSAALQLEDSFTLLVEENPGGPSFNSQIQLGKFFPGGNERHRKPLRSPSEPLGRGIPKSRKEKEQEQEQEKKQEQRRRRSSLSPTNEVKSFIV